jgi:hypothetical protein
MTKFACAREKEVEELVGCGLWPMAAAAELRAHVEGCRACSDLAVVAQAFQAAHSSATAEPTLPSAGALWWRAQLRRRNAAIERIGRPLLGAQIFALATVLLMAVGGLAWQVRRGFGLLAWIEALPRALHFDALWPTSLGGFEGNFWYVVPVLATLALVGGVVVYFASEKH